MKVALAQFAASEDWQHNAHLCDELMQKAAQGGADLLVLPEGVLARFTEDRSRIRRAAQTITGPFVEQLTAASGGIPTTVVLGIHERDGDAVFNTLVVLRDGQLIATYRKLHLYDAFGSAESANIAPGNEIPALVECAGMRLGLMTCYDVRFPELARIHADRGADVLVVPAAWVRGPCKEWHWLTMVTARALENTCYVVASGECGARNIGRSMVVDPMGIAVSQLADRPAFAWAEVEKERIDEVRARLPVLANRRFSIDVSPSQLPVSV